MTDGTERSLGRMEGKMDEILNRLDKIEPRLSRVEKQMYLWQGSIIVLGLLISLVGSKIGELFGVRIS